MQIYTLKSVIINKIFKYKELIIKIIIFSVQTFTLHAI